MKLLQIILTYFDATAFNILSCSSLVSHTPKNIRFSNLKTYKLKIESHSKHQTTRVKILYILVEIKKIKVI